MPTTWSLVRLGIRWENQICDSVALMICPDEAQKVCRIVFSCLQSLVVDLVNRKMSSMKNKWEMRIRPRKDIGCSSLSWTTFSKWIDKCSKHKIKRQGDNGSPCLTPLVGTTSYRGLPFQSIWKRIEDTIFIMRVMRLGSSQKNSNDSRRKAQSS